MSKNRKSLWLYVLSAAMVAAPVASRLVRSVRAADEKVKKTELSDKMEQMDEAMKRLRRTLKDEKQNAESLTQAKKFIDAAKASKEMTPPQASKQPEAARAKFIEDYKKGMDAIIKEMTDIETSVKDNKLDKAMEVYTKMKKMEEEDHKKFAPDEDEKK